MPRLQTAVLANAASIDTNGLVSILGAFVDTVTADQIPHKQMLWFVARVFIDTGEVGVEQQVEVTVMAVDNDDALVRVTASFIPQIPPQGVDPRIAGGGPLVFPLAIEFPTFGMYHVSFEANGELLWDGPILVRQRT
jgi:hypothetical protein